jgi:hypothetical protein
MLSDVMLESISKRVCKSKKMGIKIFLIFTILLPILFETDASAQLLYSNTGNNTTGFVLAYGGDQGHGDPANADLISTGTVITPGNTAGGGWYDLPVQVSGNFQISFQVNNNSFDGNAHLLLVNPSTNGGLDVRNDPEGTIVSNINIFSGTNFANYNQFYFPSASDTLATATTTNFPNQTWTTITISLTNNILTDNAGGQIIQTNIGGLGLPETLQVGLGYYATTYNGGAGQIQFRNITVTATPEPSTAYLLAIGFLMLIGILHQQRRKLHRCF